LVFPKSSLLTGGRTPCKPYNYLSYLFQAGLRGINFNFKYTMGSLSTELRV
jgi:hypothetical protein